MSWFYRRLIRPVLFTCESESIHDRTLWALGRISRTPFGIDFLESLYGMPHRPLDLFGLHFPNPVGLAAGMDKRAQAVPAWAAIG